MLLNDYTWTGADLGNPTLWEDPANWSPAGYPAGPTDTATFGSAVGNCTAKEGKTIGALTINSTYTGTLTVNVSLLFAGGKMAGGTVTLPSSATFEVASGTFAMSAGAVTLSSGTNGPAANPDVVLTPGFIVASGATLNMSGAETIGVTLKNLGTTNMASSTATFTNNAGILNTGGTLNLTSATINVSAGSTANLTNEGKTYNLSGNSTCQLAVVNDATRSLLEIDAGALAVTGSQDGNPKFPSINQTAGTITIYGGAELDGSYGLNQGGGTLQTNNGTAGTTATFGGDIAVSGGSVIVASNAGQYGTLLTQPYGSSGTGRFDMSGGTLSVGVTVPANGQIGNGDSSLVNASGSANITGAGTTISVTTAGTPVSGVSAWLPVISHVVFTGTFPLHNWNGGFAWSQVAQTTGDKLYDP